jgi:polysaccharide biosynthesis transport protein
MQDRVSPPDPNMSSDTADHAGMNLVNFADILAFVQRHKKSIGTSMAAAVAIAALGLFIADPVFTAQNQVLIDPGLQSVAHEQAADPPPAMDSQQLETQIAVLRSEEVSKAVVQRFKLTEDPEFRVRYVSDHFAWFSSQDTISKSEDERFRLVLAKFRKNLVVRRVGVSYAIEIFVTSRDPEQAARLANGIAEAYIRFQLDMRANAARVGSQWLETRLAELRHDMNAAARKMQEYRAAQNYSIRLSPPAKSGGTPSSGLTPVNADPARDEPLTLEELESTASTYRRTFESVLQSYMTTVQRQSFPVANARIITYATPPLSQSRQTGVLILLAGLGGVLAGALIGYWRDRSTGRKLSLAVK